MFTDILAVTFNLANVGVLAVAVDPADVEVPLLLVS
jgi:hypothetical protein